MSAGGWDWRAAGADLSAAIERRWLWTALGWNDVRRRFSGSFMGSLWLSANIALMVAALTLVFARPLGSHWSDYAPYVALGLVLWQFVLGSMNEGSNVFAAAAETIRNAPMPLTAHVLRLLWRNLIVLAHNMAVAAAVLVLFRVQPSAAAWTAVPALFLVVFVLFWTSLLLGLIGARFRDVAQIVASLMQLMFFLTPVFWPPEALGAGQQWMVAANPVFALIDIVRAPLLGAMPAPASWPVALAVAALAAALGLAALARLHGRIAYWV